MASISGKPTGAPSNVTAPKRDSGGSTVHRSSWKNNSANFKDSNGKRIQGHEWWWVISLATSGGKTSKWTTKKTRSGNTSLTSASLSLASVTLSSGKVVGVDDLFPRTKNGTKGVWYVTGISFNIRGYNSKGVGPTKTATKAYGLARVPTLSEPVQGEDNGEVSCTVTSDEGHDYHDRLHTVIRTEVEDTRLDGTERTTVTTVTTRDKSKTAMHDVYDRLRLEYDQYVRVTFEAWCEGYSGPSAKATKTLYVSWPNKPVILTDLVSCPSREQGGKVTIPIDLMQTTEHPSTGVRLQVLANVDYERAEDIPATEEDNWKNVGIPDDGECNALSVDMSLVTPETEGKRSWVRVKSWNQIEDGFFQFSDYYQLDRLHVPAPTATDDECSIVSCVSADDGKGAVVTVGFDDDGNTGTEVAWSTRSDAWTSNEQPETFKATWVDAASASQEWTSTCTINLHGMDNGTTYYVRARRYLEADSGDSQTEWCNVMTVTPSVAPGTVTLTAPASVPRGSGCSLSWAFEGGEQTAWEVVSAGAVLASGTDALGSCLIDADRLASAADASGNVSVSVIVHTGGGTSQSDESVILIADAPTLDVTASTVTAQPMTLALACSSPSATVAFTVRASGVTDGTLGMPTQVAGDVVWSDVLAPEWGPATHGDVSNLVSNGATAWTACSMTETETEEGSGVFTRAFSPVGTLLRTASATGLLASSTYTASVTGDWQDGDTDLWDVAIVDAGDSEGDDPATFAQAATVTTTTARDVWLVLRHRVYDDSSDSYVQVQASSQQLGDDVLVKLEKSATATDYTESPLDAEPYVATVRAPEGLDLRDGATYEATATATDANGLSSEVATCAFGVDWSHKAPTPSDSITVTPSDVTDEDGNRTRQCVIALASPTYGQGESFADLYDVWGSTPDGLYLIAQGVALDDTVTDPYAPYGTGEYGYRIACRTADGDVEWSDYPYVLAGRELRVDFGEGYVELPYNVAVTDSYAKDYEGRRKLDGTIDGYWNEGAERKASLSSDLIRQADVSKITMVKDMGNYCGPCFVRTPDGCAYEANVSNVNVGGARRDGAISVSFDASEAALTQYVAVVGEPEQYVEP